MVSERDTTVERDVARLGVLETVDRALRREAHVLVGRPELTWQQLYNRLQWEDEPVPGILEPELRRRSTRDAAPWLRTRTRLRESEALVRTLAGHTGSVQGCAVSPDGTWIVSASQGRALEIWDAADGTELRTPLTGHTEWVSGCAVSPDGTWIVSASHDGTLRLWDPASGLELRRLEGHTGWVNGCAVAPDGSFVVSAGQDGTLRLWDPASGAELRRLEGHGNDGHVISWVKGCAVAPDGSYVVSAGHDGTLRLWDPASGAELRRLEGHRGSVLGCVVAPDGSFVVSASDDWTLRLWDPASGAELRRLEGHRGSVLGCVVAPDGSFVVSASQDGTLRLWDPASGAELRRLEGHTGDVNGCAVAPDGTWIVSGGHDGTLRLWDPAIGADLRRLEGHRGSILGCVVAPDGSYVVSAGEDGTLRLWDPPSGLELRRLEGHTDRVNGCAVASDGSFVVSAGQDWTLRLWDPASGAELRRLEGHTLGVTGCAVAPDGSYVVSAGEDGTLRLWDPPSGLELRRLEGHTGPVRGCAVAPDGSLVVSAGSHDETLRLWDPTSDFELRRLEGHTGEIKGCAVAPDGSYVVSAGEDGTLRLWDPASGAELRRLEGHTGWVLGCVVAPDGSYVVSAGGDGTLRLWDPSSGLELAQLPLAGAFRSVAVGPSGAPIACGDSGGSVHLVELVGLEQGPIVVTAVDLGAGAGYQVRCPCCNRSSDLRQEWLGTEIACPQDGCGKPLRVNPFKVPAEEVPAQVRQERPAPVEPVARPIPAPTPCATPTLVDLVARSGLGSVDAGGGGLAIGFAGTRAEQVVVHARTLGGGLAIFAVALPKPGMFGGEAALRSLLVVSFKADYVKALVLPDGKLALACEQPLALLTPERVRGLVAGLAALGDVTKGDLGDAPGWERRLLACRRAQAAHIALDPAQATAALRDLAAAGGLPVRESWTEALVVELDVGTPLQVVGRVGEHVVSLIAFLGDAKPKGNRSAYLRRLLELNRAADVARLALDGDGNVALLYEVPEVAPDLFDRVREQFGMLHAGVIDLERGR